MKRLLLVAFRCLSLLLVIGAAGMWARSDSTADWTPLFLTGSGYRLDSWSGRVFIQRCRVDSPPPELVVRIAPPVVGGRRYDDRRSVPLMRKLRAVQEDPDGAMMAFPWVHFDAAAPRNGFGFGIEQIGLTRGSDVISLDVVALPYWFVSAAGTLPLALWYRPWRRTRMRRRLGLCHHCGYDLRASTGRCPECGVVESLASPVGRDIASAAPRA